MKTQIINALSQIANGLTLAGTQVNLSVRDDAVSIWAYDIQRHVEIAMTYTYATKVYVATEGANVVFESRNFTVVLSEFASCL